MNQNKAIDKAYDLLHFIDKKTPDDRKKLLKSLIDDIYTDFSKELQSYYSPKNSICCITVVKSNKTVYLYKGLNAFTEDFSLAAFFSEQEVLDYLRSSPSLLRSSDISNIIVQKIFQKAIYSANKQ